MHTARVSRQASLLPKGRGQNTLRLDRRLADSDSSCARTWMSATMQGELIVFTTSPSTATVISVSVQFKLAV
jgi:hypothetical protein